MQELIDQYTGVDEDGRLTRQLITQMEFDTTMHVLSEYLAAGTKVTEQGAATGRYSLKFASMGCDTTAVELAPEQVSILKRKANEQGLQLDIYEGNACSVPFVESNSQDVCVILGPLYHLQTQMQRDQAIREAHRILKPDGIIAVAYISRFFVAGMFAQQSAQLITPDVLSTLLETGLVPSKLADSFFNVGYFATPAEMESLVGKHGFTKLRHVSTDGFGRYISFGVNNFTQAQYQTWLNYHLKTCDEPSLLGSSNHGLMLAKKSNSDRV
ncbi:class I SAM-dependent methyltransferase [Alginatibacterium sediminis]|uniref:Class I SAM-dependent methyltransferase n=1 Tax=Alginatibacterium sediminis TaxID=2164068 RepID=A0A420EDK9_9ALTE|nr:class I SAM-dependent methyltransferase [Alginatibacterium sediminis]RKF18765.1 class I SAM-dependent methyltransferase [Alginatibacterium sediminis]